MQGFSQIRPRLIIQGNGSITQRIETLQHHLRLSGLYRCVMLHLFGTAHRDMMLKLYKTPFVDLASLQQYLHNIP